MLPFSLALIGDRSDQVIAHKAIPLALDRAAALMGATVRPRWVSSQALAGDATPLDGVEGVWVVPGSPYQSMCGVLKAIAWARGGDMPLLGTCGGFQHLLIEVARSVASLPDADHAESNPGGGEHVVTALSCSLVGTDGAVSFRAGSLIAQAYGSRGAREAYHCRYGLNPAYRRVLEGAGLAFTAFDESGEIRGAELAGNTFHVGVLFQPERAALRGVTPPLVSAFLRAVARKRDFPAVHGV